TWATRPRIEMRFSEGWTSASPALKPCGGPGFACSCGVWILLMTVCSLTPDIDSWRRWNAPCTESIAKPQRSSIRPRGRMRSAGGVERPSPAAPAREDSMPQAIPRVRMPLPGLLAAVLGAIAAPVAAQDAAALYLDNCASCHCAAREGSGLGPPLAPDSYRYGGRRGDIERVIGNGMVSRGMPAFGQTLSADEIAALAAYLPTRDDDADPDDEEQAAAEPPQRTFDAVPGVHDTLDYALRVEVFADGLEAVWSMAFIDADTILVSERAGRLRVIRRGVLQPQPVSGTPAVHVHDDRTNQSGLFDIALDPDHARNGWIYLSYSHPRPASEAQEGSVAMTRVVRGRLRGNAWVDQQTVFETAAADYGDAWWHFGGRMAFDDDARLYLTVGDRGASELAREPGRPHGKVHRIAGDGSVPDD